MPTGRQIFYTIAVLVVWKKPQWAYDIFQVLQFWISIPNSIRADLNIIIIAMKILFSKIAHSITTFMRYARSFVSKEISS